MGRDVLRAAGRCVASWWSRTPCSPRCCRVTDCWHFGGALRGGVSYAFFPIRGRHRGIWSSVSARYGEVLRERCSRRCRTMRGHRAQRIHVNSGGCRQRRLTGWCGRCDRLRASSCSSRSEQHDQRKEPQQHQRDEPGPQARHELAAVVDPRRGLPSRWRESGP